MWALAAAKAVRIASQSSACRKCSRIEMYYRPVQCRLTQAITLSVDSTVQTLHELWPFAELQQTLAAPYWGTHDVN
jgi:hypothetical protein